MLKRPCFDKFTEFSPHIVAISLYFRNFLSNFITLTDEDGNEFELEYIDALELDGQTYMAFFPAVEDEDADEEDLGLVILKSIMVDGEEQLSTLDSDEELERVYDRFMEQLMEDEEENS